MQQRFPKLGAAWRRHYRQLEHVSQMCNWSIDAVSSSIQTSFCWPSDISAVVPSYRCTVCICSESLPPFQIRPKLGLKKAAEMLLSSAEKCRMAHENSMGLTSPRVRTKCPLKRPALPVLLHRVPAPHLAENSGGATDPPTSSKGQAGHFVIGKAWTKRRRKEGISTFYSLPAATAIPQR